MAACNAGSLNYLSEGRQNWAWPPMMFDNSVEKVQDYLDVMRERHDPDSNASTSASCAASACTADRDVCGPLEYNFVMGVASGMPADPELLPILPS